MKIDCDGVLNVSRQLKNNSAACRDISERIETQRRRLDANSCTEEIAGGLKKKAELLKVQGEGLDRLAAALSRIAEIYSTSEEHIIDRSELGTGNLPSAANYASFQSVEESNTVFGTSLILGNH